MNRDQTPLTANTGDITYLGNEIFGEKQQPTKLRKHQRLKTFFDLPLQTFLLEMNSINEDEE